MYYKDKNRQYRHRAISLTFALPLFILLLFSVSCRREDPIETEDIQSPTTGTRTEFTLDSIFLYAHSIYLWNDALPSYSAFSPRTRYNGIFPLNAFQREVFDISQIKLRTNGIPYEYMPTQTAKYSFITEKESISSDTKAALPISSQYIQSVKVWPHNETPVAYFYINSLPSLSTVKAQLDNAFAQIAQQQTTHLIVDLRHNGGGYIKTTEYIANLIVPSTLNGKTMFSEKFNDQMQQNKAAILKNQPYLDANGNPVNYQGRKATLADVNYSESANTYYFKKNGDLQTIKQISFIVSKYTASAAELLISILKPYFSVRLIGEQTYGKPVGTFPIQIDQYSVYMTSFLLRNSAGWSDYFDGMSPNVKVPYSENDPIGNIEDPMLHAALEDTKINLVSSARRSVPILTPHLSTAAYIIPIKKEDYKLKTP